MYQAILFDLDGTLLDTRKGVKKAVKITIEQLHLEALDEGTLVQFVGPPMQDSFSRHYGMSKDEALKAANLFRSNYKIHTLLEAELYDGVIDMLCHIKEKGIKIAVATNKSHENAVAILRHYGIAQYCDYMLGSDLEGKLKKADILEMCVKQLKVSKGQSVFVGDSYYDSEGAEKVGLQFIGVTYGFDFSTKEDLQNIKNVGVAASVQELEKMLLEE